ncbi:hypothetical protein RJ639_024488 [Escallonia herrerae]|uniref:Uncharacterized protein n=1 Tax=Escallonia herrerae TaxID=1293975 RepID=A0AA88UYE9_9ASTE|nr:hypothetical protein RJ639_024488 [Escallonia herrerae]
MPTTSSRSSMVCRRRLVVVRKLAKGAVAIDFRWSRFFGRRYKLEFNQEDKVKLNTLVRKQRHKLITPEICQELENSRDPKEEKNDLISSITEQRQQDWVLVQVLKYGAILEMPLAISVKAGEPYYARVKRLEKWSGRTFVCNNA